MRILLTGILAALVLALGGLPVTVGATVIVSPSASDVQQTEPGVPAVSAACLAAVYDGQLSRAAWLAPYFSLTPAEKRIHTAGRQRCLTRAQRLAMSERGFSAVLGEHAELRCVAVALEDRGWAVRLAVTSRLLELRLYDRVFRRCGMMGALYATLAEQSRLALAPAEQRCANQVGSVLPMYGSARETTFLPAVAKVFDRCVQAPSRTAMWSRIADDAAPGAGSVTRDCAAGRLSASITFAALFAHPAGAVVQAWAALAACSAR